MNTINIYGPGCAKCTELLENTKIAMAEIGGEYTITKITDPMQFAVAGVFMTPSLSVNGKLLFSGRNPDLAELKDILRLELGSDAPKEAAPSCGCGCGCSGEGKQGKSNCGKKLIFWLVVIVLALAVIKTINRGNKEAACCAPTETTAAPVAADTLTLTYYKLGVECITCQRMEQWITEAITSNFAEQLASGELQVQSVKPTGEQVQKYQLTTKTLIANQGDKWSNLDQIWTHKDDEAAFKAYVISKTQQLLK